jgi:hypothetical protein
MKLLPSLLSGLKAVCAAFPDPRKGRSGNIAMADFGLSAVPSRTVLEFADAVPSGMMLSDQAARSMS